MSSPADIEIKNTTNKSVSIQVDNQKWIEDDAESLNNQVIEPGKSRTYRVVAKTGHEGELEIVMTDGSNGVNLGSLKIKSIKNPQKSTNFELKSDQDGFEMSAMGYRHSTTNQDLRRMELLLAQRCEELALSEMTVTEEH